MAVVFVAIASSAIGVPNVNFDELVAGSDLIAVADVSDIRLTGPAPPGEFRGHWLEASAYSADLVVYRCLKGTAAGPLTVRYVLPKTFVGYVGFHAGTRIVFLRKINGNYEISNPYYPDFPAVSGTPNIVKSGACTSDRSKVICELLNVISSPSTSAAEKSEVLRIDYALSPSREVVAAFRQEVTRASEIGMRETLEGELIAFGDTEKLPHVVSVLASNAVSPDQRIWLLYVIANHVTDPRAIGEIRPLLRSPDNRLREAAAQALWHIKDRGAVADLAVALDDPDQKVRYYAVRALSDIVEEPDWGGPGEEQFQAHEGEYLQHWRSWVKGQAAGPPR